MAENQIVSLEKSTALLVSKTQDWINTELAKGSMAVPEGYDVNNELRIACAKIAQVKGSKGQSIVSCKPESVMSSLMLMVANGLSMAKTQCYPVMYGDELNILRSYFGTVSQLTRMFPNLKVTANVVYKGDKYQYYFDEDIECYRIRLTECSFDNRIDRKENIVCAFGTIKDKTTNRVIYSEVMTMAQILKNWSKGKTHNVQDDFPTEMAKRTLINRMCKMFINSSNSGLSATEVSNYNKMTEAEYDDKPQAQEPITDKEKAIHSKSKGMDGLVAILAKEKEKAEDIPTEEEIKVNAEGEIVAEEVLNPTATATEEPEQKAEEEQELPF